MLYKCKTFSLLSRLNRSEKLLNKIYAERTMKLHKLFPIFTSLFLVLPMTATAASSPSKDFKGHRLGVGFYNFSVSDVSSESDNNSGSSWSDDSNETFLEYGYDFNGIHALNLRYGSVDSNFSGSADNVDYASQYRGNVVQAEYEVGYTFGDSEGINIKPYAAIGVMTGDLSMKSKSTGNQEVPTEEDIRSTDVTGAIGVRVTFDHLYSDLRFQTDTRDELYVDDMGFSLAFGVKF